MDENILYVKNMVCSRCISTIEIDLENLKIGYFKVTLGEIFLNSPIPDRQKTELEEVLNRQGFEILSDSSATLIEKIKSFIIENIQHSDGPVTIKNSIAIQEHLNQDYKYLSTLFSSVEGITIEKFTILQRIEKIKELLSYNELPLKEVSYLLGYSSVHHLSNQFKKETGLSPGQFKSLKNKDRRTLDKLT